MELLELKALPPSVAKAVEETAAAIRTHDALTQLQTRLRDEKRQAEEALATARAVFGEVEADMALAGFTGEEREFSARYDAKRADAEEAEAALARIERAQSALPAKRVMADDVLERAATALRDELLTFGSALTEALGAIFRQAAAELIEAAKLAVMVDEAMHRVPGVNLAAVRSGRSFVVPDFGKIWPGRPVPKLIEGDKAWPGEDPDPAGINLRAAWREDPQHAALFHLLAPVGAIHRASQQHLQRIEMQKLNARTEANEAGRHAAFRRGAAMGAASPGVER